ncbi:carbohydrate ABC transporter permease [Natronosalvus caseinilyticus]|uniref:carbohydrate ABC transporter permease n=1 Tax=Natronosalvus caseinilyticus TaxID=2953747 RepID=UPI0028A60DE8|nr:sugar ABC transporter permease [Natronosalvus caseinilyticus]
MSTNKFGRESGIRNTIAEFVNRYFTAIMLGPALVAIFVVFIYPVLYLIWQSLFRTTLATGGYVQEFVFLDNFRYVLTRGRFVDNLKNSLYYSFGSLTISVCGGLLLALAVNHVKREWLRTSYSTLLLISWASPLVVSALIWRWMFNADLGLINMILTDLGFSEILWLADPTWAMISVTFVDGWVRTPFAMIVFLAGLQAIPQHMYDAAKMDGATSFQAFRNVTIPYLLPSFAIVILINWMFSFRAFGVIWGLTQGGPGNSTHVLATWIYRDGIVNFNLGTGSATSVILVLITLAVAAFVVTKIMVNVEE